MGSCGKDMFSFVRNYHILLQSACTLLHSHQCLSDQFLHKLVSIDMITTFLMLAILMVGTGAHFGVNLPSPTANDVEHPYILFCEMFLHVFCTFSSWVIYLLFLKLLYIPDISPSSDTWLCKYFL